MGGVISWFYEVSSDVNQWMTDTWAALVIQEQKHPIILAIATIIVLSLVVTLICNLCACIFSLCCHRAKYPRYQRLYGDEKHNYAAIPSSTQPPYNPTAPSTSKGFLAPVSVHQV